MLGARSRLQRNDVSALRFAYFDVLGQPGLGPGAKVECAGRSGSPSVVQDRTVGTTTAGFTLDFHSAGVGSGHSGVGRHGDSTMSEIPHVPRIGRLQDVAAPPVLGRSAAEPEPRLQEVLLCLPRTGYRRQVGVRRTFGYPMDARGRLGGHRTA
jgi:hypothetical protein